jgi:hypothetical protein
MQLKLEKIFELRSVANLAYLGTLERLFVSAFACKSHISPILSWFSIIRYLAIESKLRLPSQNWLRMGKISGLLKLLHQRGQ